MTTFTDLLFLLFANNECLETEVIFIWHQGSNLPIIAPMDLCPDSDTLMGLKRPSLEPLGYPLS